MKGFFDLIQNYQKEVIGFLVFGAVLTGGVYYYRSYSFASEAQAHRALTETLQEVAKTMRGQGTWEDVGIAALAGHRQNKNSSLAPYFLSIQAEAALHKGDFEEAINLMSTALSGLKSSSAVFHAFQLKYARMLLDSKDEKQVNTGLTMLEKLANSDSSVQDAAGYYLGDYYAAHDNISRAHELWRGLVDRYGSRPAGEVSVWAELAKSHL